MSFIKNLLDSIAGNKPDSLFVLVDKKGIMRDFAFNKKGEAPNRTLADFIDKRLSISKDDGFVPDNSILKYDLKNLYIPFSQRNRGKYFAEGIFSYLHKENVAPELSMSLRDAAFAVQKGIDLNKLDDLSVLSGGLLEKYDDYSQFLYKQDQLSVLYKDDLYFVVETNPGDSFIIAQNDNGRKELKKYMQDIADRFFTDKSLPDSLKIFSVRYDEHTRTIKPDEVGFSKEYNLNPNQKNFLRFVEDFELNISQKNDTLIKLLYMERFGYDKDFVSCMPEKFRREFNGLERELYDLSDTPYYRTQKGFAEEKGKEISACLLDREFDLRGRVSLKHALLDWSKELEVGGRILNSVERTDLFNGKSLYLDKVKTGNGNNVGIYIWYDSYRNQILNSSQPPNDKRLRHKNNKEVNRIKIQPQNRI